MISLQKIFNALILVFRSGADNVQMAYSIFSMFAMLLYFALVIDLAVLSTKVSAYVLVCIWILSEVSLFCLPWSPRC